MPLSADLFSSSVWQRPGEDKSIVSVKVNMIIACFITSHIMNIFHILKYSSLSKMKSNFFTCSLLHSINFA